MTIVGRNNLLALTSYEWLRQICRDMPTHQNRGVAARLGRARRFDIR